MRIDLHLHDGDEVLASLERIETALSTLLQKEQAMSLELDALTAAVNNVTTIDESAIAMIQGLAAQIASLKNDPVALQALADSLNSESDKLAAAVSANTSAVAAAVAASAPETSAP